MFPLYTTHVFKNYKHIYISLFDFRPIYDEKTGETKEDFKLRWKDFQKMILPHVINSQKEHLRIIEANKNNPEFYTKKDLEKLPYFGKQKSVEKNITKNLPKFEKIMENYS